MEIFDRLKAKGILEARVGFRGKNGDINLTHVRCYPDFREEEEGRKKVHCDNQTRHRSGRPSGDPRTGTA